MDKRLRHLAALRYFESAARHKSYSKAADELCVSQAAVSQKLRQLETSLGCQLFYRQGRQMLTTQLGAKLHHQVSQGFDNIIRGLDEVQPTKTTMLTVNTTPSFATRWLMPRLWKFSVAHPTIPIRIDSSSERLTSLPTNADIAVGEISPNDIDGSQYCYELLFEEPIYPVCSPRLLQHAEINEPKDLLKCWLVTDTNKHHFSWQQWFEKAGVCVDSMKPQWLEVATLDLGINAVVAGHGVCPATDSLAGDFIQRGLLVKPFDITLTSGIQQAAIYHTQSIQAFIQWLQEESDVKSRV